MLRAWVIAVSAFALLLVSACAAPPGTDDTGADASSGSSGGDAGTADTGIECPGGPNCECNKNSECDSGACVDTQDGKICVKSCTDDCPVPTSRTAR